MENEDDLFATKDLGLASAIVSKSIPLVRLTPSDKYFLFTFKGKKLCEEVEQLYFFGHLMVDAQPYFHSIKTLKDMVHNSYPKHER